MNRRLFMKLPLLLAATFAEAKLPKMQDKVTPFKVNSKKDRFNKELHIMGGEFMVKVSGKDTAGAVCIYDTYREAKGGPATHLHHEQDEWFYVVKGEFIVKVGEELFTLKDGDSVFAPRKIPHEFAKVNEGPGQMMVMFQPSGTMEEFFVEMSKFGSEIPKDQASLLKDLWAKHGMEVTGPALSY